MNYARGVWYRPLLVPDKVSDFLVADRGGGGHNRDEQDLAESAQLTAEAVQAAP